MVHYLTHLNQLAQNPFYLMIANDKLQLTWLYKPFPYSSCILLLLELFFPFNLVSMASFATQTKSKIYLPLTKVCEEFDNIFLTTIYTFLAKNLARRL